ncbi:hypothetical protein ACHRV1_24855 [Flavobacterium aquidurense]|uniref:hypothetical protein n=1 Tax=Flavobacterium aquidurense TaxID=362413 RepID=UPI0037583866
MIKRYHGTSTASAAAIIGPPSLINLSLGGGELGVGFYVGVNVSLCAARAKSKYNSNTALIEFQIDKIDYDQLTLHNTWNRSQVKRLWRRLNRTGQRNIHIFGYDVIRAPYAVIFHSFQEKFESLKAKVTLESSTITII